MKIAVIFPKDSEALFNRASVRTFGGANVQMFMIARELFGRPGVEPFSLIPDYPVIDFDDAGRFNLVPAFKEGCSIFRKVLSYHRTLRRIKPDVILQRGLTIESCFMALYARIFRMRFVFMLAHDIESEGRYQTSGKKCILFPILLKLVYRIIYQNAYQKLMIQKYFENNPKKLIHIYSGYPLKRKRKNKGKNILWIARCDKWKRPEVFIETARNFKNNNFIMICPSSSDSSYYNYIRNKALVVSNIKFINFEKLENINSYFEETALFANTSEYEGYPQTFIQSAMNCVPIVSLKVDPNSFITQHNCGIVCNNDIFLFNNAINELLSNEKLHELCSSNIYTYYLNNHLISNTVTKLLDNIM